MPRGDRLLDLLRILGRHDRPVTGRVLAAELGISLRTLCRDVAALQARGAAVEGEPGLGYVLRSGDAPSALLFLDDELDAIALGLRSVADRAEPRLAAAARSALARIATVRPGKPIRAEGRLDLSRSGAANGATGGDADRDAIRAAIRRQRKLLILYREPPRGERRWMIWPLALGFEQRRRVVIAFCEASRAVRRFRMDRIAAVGTTEGRYPGSRTDLLAAWRAEQAGPIAPQGHRMKAEMFQK